MTKKGTTGSRGIQLTFDENDNPRVAEAAESLGDCLGGVKCRYCEPETHDDGTIIIACMSPRGKGNSVFSFGECPEGKWAPIEHLGEAKVLQPAELDCDWDACCNCGTTTMWRLKPGKTLKKANKKANKELERCWVCAVCHPPPAGLKEKGIETRSRRKLIKEKEQLL